MKPPHGRADYLLFLDGRAAGVVEAKKEGETLTGVEWQSAKYVDGLPDELEPAVEGGLAFVYESTGTETRFTNRLDPDPASRPVFSFHRPETLTGWLDELRRHPAAPTLRHRLRALPDLQETGLWPAQFRAIENLETSLAANRPRALIQMATGSGKTFTAANVSLPAGQVRRRAAGPVPRRPGEPRPPDAEGVPGVHDAGRRPQVHRALQRPAPRLEQDRPGRARLRSRRSSGVYSILRGDPELDPELDEHSPYELTTEPVPVEYNPAVPPETFDVVIVDECHRSIYGLWRQVLDYFDAFTIGLTATPNKQAFGFFNQNLVMEYGHEQAVADEVNVDFDVYRIRTEITEQGARRSTPGSSPSSATGRPAAPAGRSSTKTSPTRRTSSTAPSSRATRSAPCSRRSATGCSPRSSPAAARCRRR